MTLKHVVNREAVIVGGGPCGLAAGIALQDTGLQPIVIEKGNVVHAIYRYPTHQTFFSTPDKLEIGRIPFIIEARKPKRNQALSYYREVVNQHDLHIHTYERVTDVAKQDDDTFVIRSTAQDGSTRFYKTPYVILATGYYDNPNLMNIPGEEKEKVLHYFKEAHPYFNQDVVIIGGKNSAVDAALELEKAGARVTVLYRGDTYSKSVKPWILPEFQSLIRHEKINMEFEATVLEIRDHEVVYKRGKQVKIIPNDFVFAMTGYKPDHAFLRKIGVGIEKKTGRPVHDKNTMETNVQGLFIAGVIAAGNDANEIFIENGRFHGSKIAAEIRKRKTDQH